MSNVNNEHMNNLRNKVSLIGRLGVQPEVINLQSGRKRVRFTLATNERFKNKKGEWQENTQWHTINVWGKLAEKAERFLEKGLEVFLDGKLIHRSFENKNGEKQYSTVVEATDFFIVSPKAGVL
jgi:single-strand DNA-binding protein